MVRKHLPPTLTSKEKVGTTLRKKLLSSWSHVSITIFCSELSHNPQQGFPPFLRLNLLEEWVFLHLSLCSAEWGRKGSARQWCKGSRNPRIPEHTWDRFRLLNLPPEALHWPSTQPKCTQIHCMVRPKSWSLLQRLSSSVSLPFQIPALTPTTSPYFYTVVITGHTMLPLVFLPLDPSWTLPTE